MIERETKMYVVELINLHGERVLVRAFGVEKISGIVTTVDISGSESSLAKKYRRSGTGLLRDLREILSF